MVNKKIYRILLSPLIILLASALLNGLTLFPIIPVISMAGILKLILFPVFWVFEKAGIDLNLWDQSFFNATNNNAINHLIDATIYVWAIPFFIYHFIEHGTFPHEVICPSIK